MSYLRAGLLGCGEGAEEIARRCLLHGHFDLVALCDPDPAATHAMGELTGIDRTFLRPGDLLHSGVDFVIARLPSPERDAAVRLAIGDGVPCLLLAPSARELSTAEEIAMAAAISDTRIGVWLRGLEDPALLELRGRWEHEDFGEPTSATVRADPLAEVPGHERAGPLALLSWLTARPVVDVERGAGKARLRGGLPVSIEPTGGPGIEIAGSDGSAEWKWTPPDFDGDMALLRTCDPIGRFAAWLDDSDDYPLTGDEALAHVRLLATVREAMGPTAT